MNLPLFHKLVLLISFRCHFILSIYFLHCQARDITLELLPCSKESSSPAKYAGNFFICCIFILHCKIRPIIPAIHARLSASQSNIASTTLAFSGKAFGERGGWLLVVMDEFSITFALMLSIHQPINFVFAVAFTFNLSFMLFLLFLFTQAILSFCQCDRCSCSQQNFRVLLPYAYFAQKNKKNLPLL